MRWSAEGLALTVVVHDQKRVNAVHAHEAAFVTVMLDGEYRESTGQRSLSFDRFTTVFHPAQLEHQDAIGAPGVRLLMFEFRPELLEGADIDRTRFRSMRDLSGSSAAWQILSLHRDAEDGDPLEIENRAFEILAGVAPLAATPRDVPSLERARDYIHERFRDRITMKEIATAAGIHPVHLGQSFHREHGETVGSYVTRLRLRDAAERLSRTDAAISAIAYDLGYCDQSHFQRVFKRVSGYTPAGFRHAFGTVTAVSAADERSPTRSRARRGPADRRTDEDRHDFVR
jgi:AraC family transcriptional regulator